uniref:Uncharacterized protein n=1 Tax=Curvibacter symbiont subsp. Hydra magnipapillata TaxID=667019 RepID=C9Y956_CURXX|nr:hypothetical protein Csp_A06570 [Curvibacter putative symbiont of Hydra magnipapillata]
MSKKIFNLSDAKDKDKDGENFKVWCSLFSQSYLTEHEMKKNSEKRCLLNKQIQTLSKNRKLANY